MLILELSLSGSLTASEQGSLMTIGEFLNISTLDPLLSTFLIATLCLCVLSVITYYSLVVAWEVFWASQQSPSPLDSSAEVVLTVLVLQSFVVMLVGLYSASTILSYIVAVRTWHIVHSIPWNIGGPEMDATIKGAKAMALKTTTRIK